MVYVNLVIKNEGLDSLINGVKKLIEPPDYKVTAGLEAALNSAFAKTQVETHVITTQLKLSGRTQSKLTRAKWSGSILYGGPAGAGRNLVPVNYAIYEMARGGTHDFFRDLHEFDSAFEDAIDLFFRPLKGDK